MKVLLIGANGQVGYELQRSLAALGQLVCATRDGRLTDGGDCEVADLEGPGSLASLIARIAPDVVVNAAAYTAVDRAEADSETVFRINAEAPAVIAKACRALDALLVHYSTDYVFDGSGVRPYREDDRTSPLGVYGESKLSGERAVAESGCRHYIFRTAWVYASHGKNFMLTMLRLANERDELRVVADQVGTPTSAALIADVTARVLNQPFSRSGIWNLTALGETSWHGFASRIVELGHERGLIAHKPVVIAIDTSAYPTPARRPAYSTLDCEKLQSDFQLLLPTWDQALETVLG